MPARFVTPFEIAVLRFDPIAAYGLPPDDPSAATVELPVLAYHLALPGRSVLVDAPAYDEAETPEAYRLPGYVPPPPLLDQLRERGIAPESITDVIVTHPHFDHVTGLTVGGADGPAPAFARARHWLGRADWRPDALDARERHALAALERAGLARLVDGDVDLGDGLELVAAPGETPGHQLARARSGGQVAYLAGDLYHHPVEFDDPGLNVVWVDVGAMRASKRALMDRAEREGARVHFSHIRGPHVVRRTNEGLSWAAVEAG